jgi:hypothetical protein
MISFACPSLKQEPIKRDDFFKVKESRWVTLVDDDRALFRIELNFGMAFLHLELRRFGPKIMRECKEGMTAVKRLLRQDGYKFVHVMINDNDTLLYKWETKMGFTELRRKGGYILMRQSTEIHHGEQSR